MTTPSSDVLVRPDFDEIEREFVSPNGKHDVLGGWLVALLAYARAAASRIEELEEAFSRVSDEGDALVKALEDACRAYDQQVASEREDARAAEAERDALRADTSTLRLIIDRVARKNDCLRADLTRAREEIGALREVLRIGLESHGEPCHRPLGGCTFVETAQTLLSGSTSTETSPAMDETAQPCSRCGRAVTDEDYEHGPGLCHREIGCCARPRYITDGARQTEPHNCSLIDIRGNRCYCPCHAPAPENAPQEERP